MNDELGRRDDVTIAIRNVASVLPKLGLVKKPMFHKDGVTFIVAVKDEERWIKPCILSIEKAADEIIVVDSSMEDNTTKIVQSLAEQNNKIKHIRFYWQGANAFALSLHIGLVNSNYKWVFKWDSDLVAKSDEALAEWISRLKLLDKNRYYVIDVARINLEGDLQHQLKRIPFGTYEGRLFTWSPELKWSLRENYYEVLSGDSIWGYRFPPWFKTIRWHEPYIFHCNIKSPRRMLLRYFWIEYMKKKDPQFHNLEEYAAYEARKQWNMSLEEAEKKVFLEMQQNLIPYEKEKYGKLPEVLKN